MLSKRLFYQMAVLYLLLISAMLLLAACSDSDYPENINAESSDAGVVVHGYGSEGWIKNTNSFSVRVKQVWLFRGEETKWMKELKPGEEVKQYISNQHGFHIYNMEGVEIGWVRPVRNGKPSN